MTGMKGLFNLGKIGALKAITSDFAKNKIKGMADKYIYHINCRVQANANIRLCRHKGKKKAIHR